MRVVADTNVLISAFLFGGLPRVLVSLGLSGSFSLITSGPLLDELEDKLRNRFAVPEEKLAFFLSQMNDRATIVHPTFALDAVPNDPDDDRVLECAVAGNADLIVSGDKHLLRLGSYQSIRILTVRQFLESSGLGAN
jgi:putative PIN family toxin of toxin-antitoxin system